MGMLWTIHLGWHCPSTGRSREKCGVLALILLKIKSNQIHGGNNMAYIDVDKDIRYYTDPLEEKVDVLDECVTELQKAVHLISESLNAIEEMLKIIRKEQEDE
jgi:hypothetical protein